MKNFYLHNGQQQIGPFSIEELKEKQITKDTHVWTEGMHNWDKACNVEALKSIFLVTPPPFKITPLAFEIKDVELEKIGSDIYPKKKNKFLVVWIIFILAIGIAFFIFTNQNDSDDRKYAVSLPIIQEIEKTPEELRQELLVKEQASPEQYLSHEGTWRENIFGLTVLEGKISNTATLANFKDVVLSVTWLTKTNTEIKTSLYSVYELVGAGKSINYKLKVDAPSQTGGVRIEINSATPLN